MIRSVRKRPPMFKFLKKQKPANEKRSLDELRQQLCTLDPKRLAELKGGQGTRQIPPSLKACGGWIPQ